MNIKGYTGRLVAVCTITGLAIGSGLVLGYRSLDEQAHQLGSNSLALKQVDNLRQQLGDYLNASDQVLKKGESTWVNSALRHQEQLVILAQGVGEVGVTARGAGHSFGGAGPQYSVALARQEAARPTQVLAHRVWIRQRLLHEGARLPGSLATRPPYRSTASAA